MRPTAILCLAAALLASSAGARAMTTSLTSTDSNLWLEDVEGAKALDWVRAQNADSIKAIAQAPGFNDTRDFLRGVLTPTPRFLRSRRSARTTTTSGRTRTIRPACGGAPRPPTTATRTRPGKRCSTWTR